MVPELSAEDRSWVGLIVQAGIRGFVDWYRDSGDGESPSGSGSPPPSSARTPRPGRVINLQQTVDLVRLSIEVVESNIDEIIDPARRAEVHAAVLRYAREVAFATAEVYARAAEVRGAWDARLEALVVDAVLRVRDRRGRPVPGQRAGLVRQRRRGRGAGRGAAQRTETDVFDEVRRVAAPAGMDALCATQGERLVVVLGGVDETRKAADAVVPTCSARVRSSSARSPRT